MPFTRPTFFLRAAFSDHSLRQLRHILCYLWKLSLPNERLPNVVAEDFLAAFEGRRKHFLHVSSAVNRPFLDDQRCHTLQSGPEHDHDWETFSFCLMLPFPSASARAIAHTRMFWDLYTSSMANICASCLLFENCCSLNEQTSFFWPRSRRWGVVQ